MTLGEPQRLGLDLGDRQYLSIGEVLEQLRDEFPDVTISKIRFLESQGLIDPERTPSGYRKFYDADVERLRFILHEQREHFLPLKVIKDRLESGDPAGPANGAPVDTMAARGGGREAAWIASWPGPQVLRDDERAPAGGGASGEDLEPEGHGRAETGELTADQLCGSTGLSRRDLGERVDADVAARLDAPQVDLEAAGRMAQLGKIAVQQRRAAAEGLTHERRLDPPLSSHAVDHRGLARVAHVHRLHPGLRAASPSDAAVSSVAVWTVQFFIELSHALRRVPRAVVCCCKAVQRDYEGFRCNVQLGCAILVRGKRERAALRERAGRRRTRGCSGSGS